MSQIVPDVVPGHYGRIRRAPAAATSLIVADEDMCVADSIEELAEITGLGPEALVATVTEYNDLCAAGLDDPRFERPAKWMAPI